MARCRAVALMRGARSFGLPSASKPSSSLISANSGSTLSTGVSGLSLPRSIRIIAAVLPTALVIEKMRNTVSSAAGLPGAASPAAPDQVTPLALAVMATAKGRSWRATASSMTRFSSDMSCLLEGGT